MRVSQDKMMAAEEKLIREKQKNKECMTLIKRLQRVLPLVSKVPLLHTLECVKLKGTCPDGFSLKSCRCYDY